MNTQSAAGVPDARDAAQAADLLVTVAETLNARLAEAITGEQDFLDCVASVLD